MIANQNQTFAGRLKCSRGDGHRCLHNDLDRPESLCQSAMESGGQGSSPADLVLVAPTWKTQPWYPALLEMCTDFPQVLPEVDNLIQPSYPLSMPDLKPRLAVWSISGRDTRSRSFQRKQQSSYSLHRERNPERHMTLSSRSGLAGVVQGVPIPFRAMWAS